MAAIGGGRHRAREAGTGGTTAQSGPGGLGRGDGHRRRSALWGHPPDRAPLAQALCPLRARRSRRPPLPARPAAPIRCRPRSRPASSNCRRAHPAWGPRTLRHELEREGVDPLPGRSSIYRCLVRHGLIDPRSAQAQAGRLSPLGTEPLHGTLADGRHGRGEARRRQRPQDRHRPR